MNEGVPREDAVKEDRTMADPQKVLKLLRTELDLQTRHLKLLEAQQTALMACDRPRFCGMQAEQELMLQLLDAQKTAREAEMQDASGNLMAISVLMERCPEKTQRALGLVRDSLIKTIKKVQEISERNEQLIENELEYIAFTLDLFVEAGRKTKNDYGGFGSIRSRMLLDRRA
jgi:hypothetical protein